MKKVRAAPRDHERAYANFSDAVIETASWNSAHSLSLSLSRRDRYATFCYIATASCGAAAPGILPASSTFGIASHQPGNGKPAARTILTRRPRPFIFPLVDFYGFPPLVYGCSTNTNQQPLFFALELSPSCQFTFSRGDYPAKMWRVFREIVSLTFFFLRRLPMLTFNERAHFSRIMTSRSTDF